MISKEIVGEVTRRLVETYNPVSIYLFGSYAWGTPTDDSDLDLVIIVEDSNEKSFNRIRPGQRALFGLGISKDLIVYTRDEFERYSKNESSLCYKIKHDGKMVYARA